MFSRSFSVKPSQPGSSDLRLGNISLLDRLSASSLLSDRKLSLERLDPDALELLDLDLVLLAVLDCDLERPFLEGSWRDFPLTNIQVKHLVLPDVF